ncbi:Uncharacterised protein [Halioglobus japonicus]|nr:Uncharacterised protein [Halioglobus japonicus]
MRNNFCLAVVVCLLCLIGGCAHSINQYNADRYYELGLAAEQQQNWGAAREYYWRAWVNARDGNAAPEYQSAVLYNLGRMMGYTCDFQQSEALLRESLDREVPLSGPDSANISKRLSELARLNFDQEKYSEAASYYARAIPMVQRLGIEKDDPVILANSLNELSQAYQLSGQAALAVASAEEAATIRARNKGHAVGFVPVRYTTGCPR